VHTYVSERRGWLGSGMRGAVREKESGSRVMQTRSEALAQVVARLLNGEEVRRRPVDDPSPLSRYSLSQSAGKDGQWSVYAALSTAQNPSAFGDGIIARTTDEALGRRVVALLNEVDPEPRRRARRGIGWW
jgi:hypothetical protein